MSRRKRQRTECFLARTLPFTARKPTHRLPQRGGRKTTTLADEKVFEAGEASVRSVGNHRGEERCREKDGDVEGPWVIAKDSRCEPAFFAYFLCGGKESKCRPAQGQHWQTENTTRMPAKNESENENENKKTKNQTLI
ncbi:MAG TPA: hypothetical protein VN289_07475 [Paraburkholderia sp.]|nr:hypothetical protein [Paraburkholderia sp.]